MHDVYTDVVLVCSSPLGADGNYSWWNEKHEL